MFETLRGILIEKMKVDPEAVSAEATLAEMDLDSLALVELSLIIEGEFDVSLDDMQASGETTLAELVTLVSDRCARA